MLKLHNSITNPSNYIIDIGASHGVSTDPVYNFISNNKYNGLCIEGDKNKVNVLKHRTSFDIYDEFIYPSNIVSVFQKFNVPIDIDILKIDIDGFDLEVLRTILAVYKPKIIIAEINEKIPPPVLFEVIYKDNYEWDESHCFGFSIQSGEIVMNKFGYKILQIHELNNILCINQDLCDVIGTDNIKNIDELYKTQYINDHNRFWQLPWNSNINYWLEIKDTELLKKEITNYFCNDNNRSKFAIKTKTLNVDFIIS